MRLSLCCLQLFSLTACERSTQVAACVPPSLHQAVSEEQKKQIFEEALSKFGEQKYTWIRTETLRPTRKNILSLQSSHSNRWTASRRYMEFSILLPSFLCPSMSTPYAISSKSSNRKKRKQTPNGGTLSRFQL